MPDLDDDASSGGTDTDDATAAAGDDTGTADTSGGGGNTSTAATQDADKGDAKDRTPKFKGEFDLERYQRDMARIREEASKAKADKAAAEAKAQDTLKAVAKALGLAEDDKPDPEALTRQLEEARNAERQRRTENLVLRVAPGLGADPDVLLDSTAFLKAISEHGPDARDDVEDTIRDFLKKSDRYKLPTAKTTAGDSTTNADNSGEKKEPRKPAGRSGADLNGSSTRPRQWTQADLDAAVKAGKNQEIVDAQNAGLLDHILNGA